MKRIDNTDTKYTYQLSRLKSEYFNIYQKLLTNFKNEHIDLEKAVGNFVNIQQLFFFEASKTAWEETYSAYLMLGPFCQTNSNFSNSLSNNRDLIALNRMDEGYIDFTQGNPSGGIINDPTNYPSLYSSDLLNFNQIGSLLNVSIGFHAMEFLLWGEDLQANDSGNRSAVQFSNNYTNGERRRVYLRSVNERLKIDFNLVFSETGKLSAIKKLNSSESADLLFNSLSNHINYVAEDLIKRSLDTQDENFELDKFSDKTNLHLLKLIEGIGIYLNPKSLFPNESRYFLLNFISDVNPDASDKIANELENTRSHLALLTSNFDQAITKPQDIVHLQTAYNSLKIVQKEIESFLSEISKN